MRRRRGNRNEDEQVMDHLYRMYILPDSPSVKNCLKKSILLAMRQIFTVLSSYRSRSTRRVARTNYSDRRRISGTAYAVERLDKASSRGPWTMEFLRLINKHPGVRSTELAAGIVWEAEKLKLNIHVVISWPNDQPRDWLYGITARKNGYG
ncbi:hypothetical protein M4D81_34365 [Paenibacillus sp. p3-SID867]|uniref:hypothetical protein n=1 Tax=Paenibacillus sp. p3-SID867 TaxID=2916363 RepID=UPI0021A5A291|nr:hypothetical protein [Paenibacillus sp. p3-SID867]MCT1404094.1 hypothetical protein [Paenibacillus sp. p3-SID867]